MTKNEFKLLRKLKSISGVYSINGNNINRVISEFIRHSLNVNFEPDFGSFGPIENDQLRFSLHQQGIIPGMIFVVLRRPHTKTPWYLD